jgi:indolepyruvate ferredoxin oxidoreductase beta subunit
MTQPDWFRIVVCGVGGQGVLLVSRILCDAAMRADLPVVSGEIRNMAQRGGAVLATVVIGGARSTVVPNGGADVVLGLEPMEAARVTRFMSERTMVITNTHPVVPFTLSVQGRPYPPLPRLLSAIEQKCGTLYTLDATQLAVDAGSIRVLNTVMLGALAGSSSLSIDHKVLEETIAEESPSAHVQMNMDAFRAGVASVSTAADKSRSKAHSKRR